MMSAICSEDTVPELRVRRALWRHGIRFRLHAADLPGKPDVVLRPRRIAIFVHGCLWHLHEGCKLGQGAALEARVLASEACKEQGAR